MDGIHQGLPTDQRNKILQAVAEDLNDGRCELIASSGDTLLDQRGCFDMSRELLKKDVGKRWYRAGRAVEQ